MNGLLAESVQRAVDSIIVKENYKTPPEIEISHGSQEGDGYASKTYAISIKSDDGKYIKLFVKYLPEPMKSEWKAASTEAFNTEYNFYAEIYPVLNQFEKSKNIKEPFKNVPKHFKTNVNNDEIPPIVLENLRSLGYTLRDRKKPIDDAHLKLPIIAFARYHAVNYAIKDQEPEKYKKLTTFPCDVLGKHFLEFGLDDTIKRCADQVVDSFDPVVDKEIMKHCENLSEKIINYVVNIFRDYDDYFIIGQGDCWSNNMMFLYDDETGLPTDVKLIDWQCQRISSPIFDFSYFFYTLATKKELDNAEYYLKLYYDTLSQRIIELGSDPEKVYPYHIFRDHWRKYSLFGLCMAFFIVKALLFEKEEVPNMLNPEIETNPTEAFSIVLQSQDLYIKRIRDLIEYFINQGLL